MKICQDHWDVLRARIDDLGLTHLVASNEEDLMEIIRDNDFDPLWMANALIWENALEAGGPYLLTLDENGEQFCPLCEVEQHSGSVDQWILGATTDVLNEARRRNLVPRIQ